MATQSQTQNQTQSQTQNRLQNQGNGGNRGANFQGMDPEEQRRVAQRDVESVSEDRENLPDIERMDTEANADSRDEVDDDSYRRDTSSGSSEP